jgi:hypothetical protein
MQNPTTDAANIGEMMADTCLHLPNHRNHGHFQHSMAMKVFTIPARVLKPPAFFCETFIGY